MEKISETIKEMAASPPKEEPTWSCRDCRDQGFTDSSVSYQCYGMSDKHFCPECEKGRAMYDEWKSKPAQQANLRAWKQERIERALRISGIEGLFRAKRLTDLKGNPKLHAEITKYLNNWKTMKHNGYGFYFWGNVGAGKTHAAIVLANELMEREMVEVLFLNMPEAITRVKNTFDSDIKTEDSRLFERMKEMELLVLDDVGVEKYSDWMADQMYQIIDHRWKNRKPMIITSNLSLEDLGKIYKPQIASRIMGNCKPIRFTERDRRNQIAPLF
jgi:DNA replication protein DnaC